LQATTILVLPVSLQFEMTKGVDDRLETVMTPEPQAERSLARVLDRRAERPGDKPWIITGGDEITAADMASRSNRLARGLAAAGIGPGETVLIMLPDGAAILEAWCALARLGAIEVPVNNHLRGNVLAHVINKSAGKTMIVDGRYLDRIAAIASEIEGLERLVLVGDGAEALAERFAIERFEALFAVDDSPLQTEGPRHRDLMAVMYTSGTTGPSKGVMITHAHAYEYALAVVELLELGPDDIYYSPLPLFHIAGQWAAVYACLIAGATVVVPERFSLAGFWADVRAHGASCTFLLGAMANFLYRETPAADDAENPMERMLVVPLLPEVEDFKKRFGVRVSTTWGSTEINVPTRSSFDLADNRTCGRIAEDRYEVRIVDADDQEVSPGTPGEAVVRGKHPWMLMAGYWNDPEATATATRNQWVHSGDMLMRDEAGNFYFVDRVKDAIRRRGENISSMEVENEINAFAAVLECAVVPVASEHTEQEVMAVVVPKDSVSIDPEALIRFLEPRMAYFMVPRYIEMTGALPRTQTGKIQKYELRARGVTERTWDREAAGMKLKR